MTDSLRAKKERVKELAAQQLAAILHRERRHEELTPYRRKLTLLERLQPVSWSLDSWIQFCYQAHAQQRDRYVDSGYYRHLAEVAALAAGVELSLPWYRRMNPTLAAAVAWGHDLLEDTETEIEEVLDRTDERVLVGIAWLTDTEPGNRAARTEAAWARLGEAPPWTQRIKIGDIESNTRTIAYHDPKFAHGGRYLADCQMSLAHLTGCGHPRYDQIFNHLTDLMLEGARQAEQNEAV